MSNLERLKNRIAAEQLDAVLLLDSYNRHFATGFHSSSGAVIVTAKDAWFITDSRYMSLIDTRATAVLEHNPECKKCEHAMECLAGCRATALETSPTDILAIDKATCAIFKGGWVEKIRSALQEAQPHLRCRSFK